MRVATRPNPEINIGAVDLSCAFVVCDAELDDFPIVYCSDNFERLTGYGHYHETYRIEDGAWRIATLTLTRLKLDIVWPDGEALA